MSLFEQDGDPVTFDALVGEGKKYKDPDAAAKAIVEKDRFIEQLKWEKQEALKHAAVSAPDRSQEILDQLKVLAEERQRRLEQPVTERTPTGEPERTAVKTLTEDDVLRILQTRDQQSVAVTNLQKVKAELKDKFGTNTNQVLKSLQDQMGVGEDFLESIAARSPAAFMKLLDGQKTETVFTPPPSSTTQTFAPTAAKHQPRSYYKQLRQQNKAMYDSPAVQTQMYKDAMALGEAYLDVPD